MAAPSGTESFAELGKEIAEDAARVVRAEVELAKARVLDMLGQLKWLLIAAVVAAFMLVLLVIFGLATIAVVVASLWLPSHPWIPWLVLTALCLAVAIALGFSVKGSIGQLTGEGKATVGTFKEDLVWLKQLTKRSTNDN